MGSRPKEMSKADVPGPGTYTSIGPESTSAARKAPSYSLGGKVGTEKIADTPGPGAYNFK